MKKQFNSFCRVIFALTFLFLFCGFVSAQIDQDKNQIFPSRLNFGEKPFISKTDTSKDVNRNDVQSIKKGTRVPKTSELQSKAYSAADLARIASATARRYNIPEILFFSLIQQESLWRIGATSYKGAKGLTQLMPGTAIRFGLKVNPFADERVIPEKNLDAGARYFRFLLDTFGNNYALALAAYNAGEGAVMKYNYQIPPYAETRNYVAVICTSAFGSIQPCLSSGTYDNNRSSLIVKTVSADRTRKRSKAGQTAPSTKTVEPNNEIQKPLRINTSVFQTAERNATRAITETALRIQ